MSKCLIHLLILLKYKNTFDLCDIIHEKEKRRKMMVKKCFVLHEEVSDVFHDKIYIPTIEKLPFNLANVRILGSMKYGTTRDNCFRDNA